MNVSINCSDESADAAVAWMGGALDELYEWCLNNKLTPHPSKSEAMLLCRRNPPDPLPPITPGSSVIIWVTKLRLLGMTVDNKLTWLLHVLELKKSFANKLRVLKQSRFLLRSVRQALYIKVMLHSLTYGLVLWGSC